MDEIRIIHDVLGEKHLENPVMLDVGAHHGGALSHFASSGYTIYAFEPDASNRVVLEKLLATRRWGRVRVDRRAVSDKNDMECDFYTSEVSTGISSMSSFHPSHETSYKVQTVRLDRFCKDQCLSKVHFLKIDTEGYDFFVLQGMDWKCEPEIVMCEFEDSKTSDLGYTYENMAEYLMEKGYQVLVSEWEPIKQYGTAHAFRRFFRYSVQAIGENAWGNLIAFRTECDLERYLILAKDFKVEAPVSRPELTFVEKLKYTPEYEGLSLFAVAIMRRVRRALGINQHSPSSHQILNTLNSYHWGEDCFIMGNGPSLNKTDLSRLKGKHVFGLNKIYMMFESQPIDLSYLVACNPEVIEQSKEVYRALKVTQFLAAEYAEKNALDERHILHIATTRQMGHFAKSLTGSIAEGGTVTNVALQIAYAMGFKRVFLVGVDHSFKQSGRPNEMQTMTEDDVNHFHPDYFKGNTWHLADLESSELSYRFADYYFNKIGFQIYDATVDGKLNVFPKVSYDMAIDSCEDRKRDPWRSE